MMGILAHTTEWVVVSRFILARITLPELRATMKFSTMTQRNIFKLKLAAMRFFEDCLFAAKRVDTGDGVSLIISLERSR